MEQIRVNDGSKSYQIVNAQGDELCVFTFNPSDVNILERYQKVVDSLEAAIKEIGRDGDAPEVLAKAQGIIREKMDELFGRDTSSLWEVCGPLSPLDNGQLYAENILEAIGPVIEAETKQRVDKARERMAQYTAAYDKK